MNKRIRIFGLGTFVIIAVFSVWAALGQSDRIPNRNLITVYKTPSCGCCSKWVDHLRENGFDVNVKSRETLVSVRAQYGVPDRLASCHTAHIDGYAVEGHVPATDIRRLLALRPSATGISVPGMTAGSPGMEMEGRSDPYKVVLFGPDPGANSIFAAYP